MLSLAEKIAFITLALFAVGAAYQTFMQMAFVINRGQGSLYLDRLPQRLWEALVVYVTQRTTLKTRRLTSYIHLGVVLGFTFYFLVNALDTLIGLVTGFETSLRNLGGIYDLYRLVGDVLSVVVLIGMVYLILRRFILPDQKELEFHDNILLHPKVKAGAVNRDSLIVALFILVHVGARFLGESVAVAQHGTDPYMPFATIVSGLFVGMDAATLNIWRHLFWWIALGGILLFLPYFPYTKHVHLMMAPLNFLTRPKRTSLGEVPPLDFENEEIEQFGANKLEDLSKTQIFDAFACIMCNRCQEVCPAYTTGKELSPSALEVNKRYYIKDNMQGYAQGAESDWTLLGGVLSGSALWACTGCGACVDICPVGNEPMQDIFDIRRDAVLMQSDFPAELQNAFNGMERQGNPWQMAESRLAWADGLNVPTVADNPNHDVLYWTGCAVSYDPRAQQTARALVKVLQAAQVNFAVLGKDENCTGDVARRAGNEYLYYEMASANVDVLNEVNPKRIVVTCPHCLHNIGKEYHQFGGDYEVIHHTELIEELISQNKLPANAHPSSWGNVTFHDPCYLARHNDVVEAPRIALDSIGIGMTEMPRTKKNSFCCGAGGAQFWKEEEHGEAAVNVERYQEAIGVGANVMAVGCPFCMQMFESAKAEHPDGPEIKDVVELIADSL